MMGMLVTLGCDCEIFREAFHGFCIPDAEDTYANEQLRAFCRSKQHEVYYFF